MTRPTWLAKGVRLLLPLLPLLSLLATPEIARAEPKREPQDYGAPRETTPAEVLLWGPRVLFFPLWLVSEFLIRRPLGALVTVAEREQWHEEIIAFFTFGERRQVSIYPSAFFDFGLLPSVGFNLSWKYFLAEPNTIKLHFGTWGLDWIATKFVDSYAISDHESLALDLRFVRRRDNPFYGLGPRSPNNAKVRYESELAEASFGYENRPWRSSFFSARAGARHLALGDGSCCGDPSLLDAIGRGALPSPPGFNESYTGAFQEVALAIDSRKPRPEHGSGVRLEMRGEGVFAPGGATRRAWVRYGAEGGAFLDVTGTQRVISLSAAVEFADPLLGSIPFPNQATLGGDKPMRGYLRERLIDRSSFVGRFHYTWPIWVYLDGLIEADVGNVFGPYLDGFDPRLFRLSSGIGVRSTGERDSGFELLVAGGTDPFDEGFRFSSFRFVIGSHHGF